MVNSRRKGHNEERKLAQLFRAAMPGAEIKRGLQSRAGHEAADVECPKFWIESKVGRLPNVRRALKQAVDDADGTGKVPVAIVRDDRCEAFVVIRLADFLQFVREWWATTPEYLSRADRGPGTAWDNSGVAHNTAALVRSEVAVASAEMVGAPSWERKIAERNDALEEARRRELKGRQCFRGYDPGEGE